MNVCLIEIMKVLSKIFFLRNWMLYVKFILYKLNGYYKVVIVRSRLIG